MSPKIDSISPLNAPAPVRPGETLHKTVEKWVAQTFFGTLLKQMRESPFKSDLFNGGRGGQAFSPLYDQHLAERMAGGSGQKLVRAIVRRIEGGRAYSHSTQPAADSSATNQKVRPHVATDLRA